MQSESKKELENENAFLKSEIQKVQKENNSLKVDLEQMKADRDSSDQAKTDLQTRLNRISKTLDERNSEITLLSKSVKNLNEEKTGFKDDLAKVTKIVKEKEKEIYRLETMSENLSSNLIQSKDDLKKLRKDNSKSERKVKHKAKTVDKFLDNNSNISSSIKSCNISLYNCSSLIMESTSTNLSSLSTMPTLAALNYSKEEFRNEKDIFEEEIQFLKLSDQNQKAINIRLNNFMNRSRSRLLEEKDEDAKAFKQEIKLWKKKLGNERRKKIKLERKLSKERGGEFTSSSLSSSIISTKLVQSSIPNLIEKTVDEPKEEETCSICVKTIPNYTPKFSQGLLINPACSYCDDYQEDSIIDEECSENGNDENEKDLNFYDDLPPHHYDSDGAAVID